VTWGRKESFASFIAINDCQHELKLPFLAELGKRN
jgi:hypothetical protein